MDTAHTPQQLVAFRTRDIIQALGISVDHDRVISLIGITHKDPVTVTTQAVRAAIHRVNRSVFTLN